MLGIKKKISQMKLMTFLKTKSQSLSTKFIYTVLLLFNAFVKSDTPFWAKKIILGTIVYFMAPLDSIPDITPLIGYTDDLSMLSFGLVTISCYIDDEVRSKSKSQLGKIVKNYDPALVLEMDEKLLR